MCSYWCSLTPDEVDAAAKRVVDDGPLWAWTLRAGTVTTVNTRR